MKYNREGWWRPIEIGLALYTIYAYMDEFALHTMLMHVTYGPSQISYWYVVAYMRKNEGPKLPHFMEQ